MTEVAQSPSTARMIDYWLGGAHHYPVDVAAAQAFEAAYGPCAPEFAALRGFLRRAVGHLTERGIDEFLVIGAGIPTLGNVHEVAPGARVLYTDIDATTIALGQRILAGEERVAYAYGDATDLGTIDPEVLRRMLPGWGRRPTGVVFLGLAAFLDDGLLARTLDELYAAASPGSWLAFDFDSDVLTGYPQALAMMGPAFHMRRPEAFAPLLGRWTLSSAGIAPVAGWGEPGDAGASSTASFYGGVASK